MNVSIQLKYIKVYLISLKQQFMIIYMVTLFPRPRYPLYIVGWENPTNKYIGRASVP